MAEVVLLRQAVIPDNRLALPNATGEFSEKCGQEWAPLRALVYQDCRIVLIIAIAGISIREASAG